MATAELQSGRGVFVQKQRANVYTMMLILAFLEIVVACVLLYMEMNVYQFKVKVPADAKVPHEENPPAVGMEFQQFQTRLPSPFLV